MIDLERMKKKIIADRDGDVVPEVPDQWEAARTVLAKIVADVLLRHYPGWRWAVGFPKIGGGIIIRNLDIPTDYSLFIRPGHEHDSVSLFEKFIVRMAGEMLERFNIARGRFDADKVDEIICTQSKGGILIPELTGVPRGQIANRDAPTK